MFKADGTRRDFPLTNPRTIIGRKNTCELRIPLNSVSRQHCEIRIKNEQARLRDLGSSNGTFHNDTRIQEVVLEPGDRIQVGPVAFTVVINGEPDQIDPSLTLIEQAQAAESESMDNMSARPEELPLLDGDMPAIEAEERSPTTDIDEPAPLALDKIEQSEPKESTIAGELLDDDEELLADLSEEDAAPGDGLSSLEAMAADDAEPAPVPATDEGVSADPEASAELHAIPAPSPVGNASEESAVQLDLEAEAEASGIMPAVEQAEKAPADEAPELPPLDAAEEEAEEIQPLVPDAAEDEATDPFANLEPAGDDIDFDDPIAALEAMAAAESNDDDLPLLAEDEDEPKPPRKKK